jgi:hypothetical protein
MGVRASNDHGLQRVRQLQIRDIAAFTAKEALIFLPDQPRTDHSLAPISRIMFSAVLGSGKLAKDCTVSVKPLSNGVADPLRRTRYDCNLAGQPLHRKRFAHSKSA